MIRHLEMVELEQIKDNKIHTYRVIEIISSSPHHAVQVAMGSHIKDIKDIPFTAENHILSNLDYQKYYDHKKEFIPVIDLSNFPIIQARIEENPRSPLNDQFSKDVNLACDVIKKYVNLSIHPNDSKFEGFYFILVNMYSPYTSLKKWMPFLE